MNETVEKIILLFLNIDVILILQDLRIQIGTKQNVIISQLGVVGFMVLMLDPQLPVELISCLNSIFSIINTIKIINAESH